MRTGTRQVRGPRPAARQVLAGLAAATVFLAGCSAGATGGGNGGHAKVSLTFQVNHGPGTPVVKHWTLNCEPAGGSRANSDAACAALLKLKHPFAPVPPEIACPAFLLSNTKIVVTGTWFGVRVRRIIVDGGCDTALFSKLNKLFA